MQTKLPHILNTSANLLGICFFIITGIHLTNPTEHMQVMQSISIVSILLLLSIFLSYLSIRVYPSKKAYKYEQIADYLFLASIILLSVAIIGLTFGTGIF